MHDDDNQHDGRKYNHFDFNDDVHLIGCIMTQTRIPRLGRNLIFITAVAALGLVAWRVGALVATLSSDDCVTQTVETVSGDGVEVTRTRRCN